MESVYGAMRDLANIATIKSELDELQAELKVIRLQLVDSHDQPVRDEVHSLPNQDRLPHQEQDRLPSVDSQKLPPSTQLENLQRLLARSRGDE